MRDEGKEKMGGRGKGGRGWLDQRKMEGGEGVEDEEEEMEKGGGE